MLPPFQGLDAGADPILGLTPQALRCRPFGPLRRRARALELRGAVGAAGRLDRDRRAAEGALLGDRRFRRLLAAQAVDPADDEEDGEGDEQEAQEVVEEEAVVRVAAPASLACSRVW